MPDSPKIQIDWSKPIRVRTSTGAGWVRWWVIPPEYLQGFFAFWKKNNIRLKFQGYTLGKNKLGNWTLSEWKEIKEKFNEKLGQRFEIQTERTIPKYNIRTSQGLKEFQVPLVEVLCSAINVGGAALDGSDTGAGKTFVAIAVARELGMKIGVVCPKSVISVWNKIIKLHFGMSPEFVLNYEAVKTGKYKEVGVWDRVSRTSRREKFRWTLPTDTLIVFDESHRLKGGDTKNSQIAQAAKEQGYKMLFCSATNAIDPVELKTVGFILGLYKGGKWAEFLRKHDCEKKRLGWQFNGNKEVLKKLHADLFLDRGVRIRREDIKEFPDCDIMAEAYDIDESSQAELNAVYKEMEKELILLKAKSKTVQEYQASAMVAQLRARQKAELIKVPLFVDMVEEALEDGMSVVLFVNFSDTVRALSKRLDTNCIVWGNNKGDERERHVDDFQSDRKRVIIVNSAAGGVGLSLHDLNGNYPRLAIISPHPSAVVLKQCLGRVWRTGGKTKSLQKIVFVAGTVEEQVCDKLKTKLDHLDLINDGDLSQTPVFEEHIT
jgi:superfamily II DNA or RNA helicase